MMQDTNALPRAADEAAVVTKSVPPHSLAVGVPARVIRDLLKDPLPAPTAPVFRGGMDDLRS